MHLALCLCADLPKVRARTQVVFVRHVREAYKTTNSARTAALALEGSVVVPWGGRGEPFDRAACTGEGAWLLYPGPEARTPPGPMPRRLVVIDGTWRQVRKLLHHEPGLIGLPHLSLPPPPKAALRLRVAPTEQRMSTIEAVAEALRVLEGDEPAAALHAAQALLVQRIYASRGLTLPD